MSSRTIQRLVISSTLAFGVAAAGCSDDGDDTMMTDDGGATTGDAGGGTTGEDDGGTTGEDDGGTTGEPALQCGGEDCLDVELSTGTFEACCLNEDGEPDENGSVCGVDATATGLGCIEQDAEGVESEAAGMYFDRTAADDKAEVPENPNSADSECITDPEMTDNGLYDVFREGLGNLQYAGCCTPEGWMGVNLGDPMLAGSVVADTRFGCVDFLQLAAAGEMAGENEEPCKEEKDAIDEREVDRNRNMIPYCDPADGEYACPEILGVVCAGIKETFPTYECEATTPTPDWVCDRFDAPKDGEQVVATELTGLPAWVGGCGQETEAENCVPNVDATAYGTEQPEAGNTVPGFPDSLCGCGEGESPTTTDPIDCIPNTIEDACGAEAT